MALLALMVVHATISPQRAWVLLSCCDVAALATAVGLTTGWAAAVAVALLFQVSVGLPALLIGLLTATYTPTVTGVAIHLLPTAAGVFALAKGKGKGKGKAHGKGQRDGAGRGALPAHAAVAAMALYIFILALTYLVSPPAMNLNLVHTVWRPVTALLSTPVAYYGIHATVVFAALLAGQKGLHRLLP